MSRRALPFHHAVHYPSPRRQSYMIDKVTLRWRLAAYSCFCLLFVPGVVGGIQRQPRRIGVMGPVVTITLKEPSALKSSSSEQQQQSNQNLKDQENLVKDPSSVRPKATWGIQTLKPPFPIWLPSLKQVRALFGYEYHRFKYRPSWLETSYKFSFPVGDLWIQPTWDIEKPVALKLLFSRGNSGITTRWSGGPGRLLQSLSGSFGFDLPYTTVRTIRVTPNVDLVPSYPDVSCVVEATTGGAGRTKAILNLEYNNPTLAVEHRLDERNTVRPEIAIYSARITYRWDLKLPGESNIRTIVDPLDAIHVTWTDQSAKGGYWITTLRIPLEGASISALTADVSIRKQFQF